MQLALIKKQAMTSLKRNLSKAVSLVMICLFTVLCMKIIEQVFILLLDTVFINDSFKFVLSRNTILSTILTLIMYLTLLCPLLLSVKKWYMNIKDNDPPVSDALSIFTSSKRYFKAVWYSIIKNITLTAMYLLLLVPVIFFASVLKTQVKNNTKLLGAMFLILFIAIVIFLLIAIFYAVYINLGFFYADYIFLSEKNINPFKAISISLRVSKYQRGKLALLLLSLLPYLLLCVFIVPIVFCVPYIKSTLAVFAQTQLEIYLENTK